MQKGATSLVIFDLNNARTNPLAIVAAMKADPALASIPTVGYASHVQTDVINAARQAGVGSVLPRSAFTMQLGEILKAAPRSSHRAAGEQARQREQPQPSRRRRRRPRVATGTNAGSFAAARSSSTAVTARSSAASVAADS